jgi:hypothetical protein
MPDFSLLHVVKWDDRAVRVNLAAFIEEILGGLDRVQYDNDLPEHVE